MFDPRDVQKRKAIGFLTDDNRRERYSEAGSTSYEKSSGVSIRVMSTASTLYFFDHYPAIQVKILVR